MDALLDSLIQLFWAVWGLFASLGELLLPVVPLLIWISIWLFAVNWTKLRGFLLKGGWVGLLLTGLMAVLVWGVVAPPADGHHYILGRQLSNFVGKTVYVTGLICIMLLSGAVQLAGVFGDKFPPPEPEPEQGHASHGH